MATSFKRSHAHTATLRAPNPGAGHRRPTPLADTPGPSQASLGQSLVGSLLLSPGSWCTRFCLCPPIVHFWQSVSSGSSMVGVMATSSKRAYAMPKSTAPRAPAPAAGHCWPGPLQETLKQFWLSLSGVSGSWCTEDLFEPSECLWLIWGLVLNAMSPLLPSCWSFSFALGCGVSFFGGIQHSAVNDCSAVSCNFGVLGGEDERTSFYSAILE